MTTPEPTAIENTYLFLKSCIMRVLKLYMDHYKIRDLHQKMLDQIEKNSQSLYGFFKSLMETDRSYGTILYRALRGFRPCLVMNRTRSEEDVLLGRSVADVARRYLLIDMKYLGAIPYDEDVPASLRSLGPTTWSTGARPPPGHPSDVRGAGLFDRIHLADASRDPPAGHLMLKKIEDWNYYELLSVERTASQDEIWEGYQAALATYRGESLALYGLVSETERDAILGRIQEAFQTLRDPDMRQEYDLALLRRAPISRPRPPSASRSASSRSRKRRPGRRSRAWIEAALRQKSLTMSSASSKTRSGPAERSRKLESDSLS